MKPCAAYEQLLITTSFQDYPLYGKPLKEIFQSSYELGAVPSQTNIGRLVLDYNVENMWSENG